MRLFNWRRQAVLNAMPLVKPDQVRTPWHEFWRRFRRQHMAMTAALFVIFIDCGGYFCTLDRSL
ncbi:ABC transporter permease [Escherichia coli]|uniref:ABC transporter permease n=1 Tax=Escherichia coli TaxID=562 RepID=A0A2X1J0V5_ECOLX|nr:ABC transporter permease [Escherichia coli]